MASIIFLRHGQAQNNVERRLTGRLPNVPLTDQGVAQAEYAARHLSKMNVSRIYSSPIQRAQQTAQIVARHNNLEVATDERLTEIDMGSFTGMKYDDLLASQGDVLMRFYGNEAAPAAPGVETFTNVRERVLSMVGDVLAKHPGENVVLVTHMDPIKAMLSTTLTLSMQNLHELIIANGTLNIFLESEGRFSLGGLNVMEPSRLIKSW